MNECENRSLRPSFREVSRQKQLSVVFDVASAQKQGAEGTRLALRDMRLCFKRCASR